MGKWGTPERRAGHPSRGICSGAVGWGAAGCLAPGWGSSGHAGAAQAEALVGSEGLDGDPGKISQVCIRRKGWKQLFLHDAKGTALSEKPCFGDNYRMERLAFVEQPTSAIRSSF